LNILFTSQSLRPLFAPLHAPISLFFAQIGALTPHFYYWADSNISDYQGHGATAAKKTVLPGRYLCWRRTLHKIS